MSLTLVPDGNLRAQDGIQITEPISTIRKDCAGRGEFDFPMSSTDERKIPKIVLKINRNEAFQSVPESEQHADQLIYSTKAPEVAKSFDHRNSIPMTVLLKKINQNAYKSLENVLEL